jgi:hypothetical protein
MNFLNRINKIRVARYVFAVALIGALFRVLPVYAMSAGKVTTEYITAATRFRCEEIQTVATSVANQWRAQIGSQQVSDRYAAGHVRFTAHESATEELCRCTPA